MQSRIISTTWTAPQYPALRIPIFADAWPELRLVDGMEWFLRMAFAEILYYRRSLFLLLFLDGSCVCRLSRPIFKRHLKLSTETQTGTMESRVGSAVLLCTIRPPPSILGTILRTTRLLFCAWDLGGLY